MQKKVSVKKDMSAKVFAFLAILLSILGFIIAILLKRKDPYVMFYAKQSLVLFLASIAAWIVSAIIGWIPILGMIVTWILWLSLLVLWIMGIGYSISGEMQEIPIIGEYAQKINL